jgi:O-antigen ligase
MKNAELDESFLMRKYSRIAGWHMFLDHPIFGVGAGVFKFANGAEYWPGPGRKVWLQSHNTYVQLIADTGLAGTITWLIFFGSLVRITFGLRRYFRSREDIHGVFRFYPSACLFSITIMLVNGYSTHQIYSGAWYFLAALSGTLYYQLFPLAQNQLGSQPLVQESVAEVREAGA